MFADVVNYSYNVYFEQVFPLLLPFLSFASFLSLGYSRFLSARSRLRTVSISLHNVSITYKKMKPSAKKTFSELFENLMIAGALNVSSNLDDDRKDVKLRKSSSICLLYETYPWQWANLESLANYLLSLLQGRLWTASFDYKIPKRLVVHSYVKFTLFFENDKWSNFYHILQFVNIPSIFMTDPSCITDKTLN